MNVYMLLINSVLDSDLLSPAQDLRSKTLTNNDAVRLGLTFLREPSKNAALIFSPYKIGPNVSARTLHECRIDIF